MPRVAIKKKDYKTSDLTKYIRNALYEKHISQADLGELLDMSQQAVSHKLKAGAFSYKELLMIFEFLKTPDNEILSIMKM